MKKIKTYELKASNKNGIKRAVFVGLSILIEMVLIIGLFTKLNNYYSWINIATRVLAVVMVLAIYAEHKTSAMKMPWIILILAFPVAGITLFVFVGLAGSTKRMAKRYSDVDEIVLPMLPENKEVSAKLKEVSEGAYGVSNYIRSYAKYPAYENTDITYYADAYEGFKAQLEEVKKAKSFIFLEYFAIEQDGEAWKELEAALIERAADGVEVRVFYDDIGSIAFIGKDFIKKLAGFGIKVRVFNPVMWFFKLFLNNRDHRKLMVIDGKVGFTGGYNIADEYFNLTHPYGMWKDSGVRLEGDAVKSLTATFLEMWNAVKDNDEDDTDFAKYLSDTDYKASEKCFIQPYADSPMDNEHVGEDVYISIINKASDYCYIITPYLIITDEMRHALCLARKRGVDVRIITPGIPDKRMIYSVTRSFYHGLVMDGIRVYEWTPGFCHAKMCVADDKMATVGTINFDYRSLYHHFENGCFIYGAKAVTDIKKDFDEMFSESRDVTEKYLTGRSSMLRLGQLFLRLFAELL